MPRETMRMTDQQMMALIAKGDQKSFELLLLQYRRSVLGLCSRLMGSVARGEDLAQDTWLKVVQNASSYRERAPLQAWLLRVAKNTCLNELRKHKWENELSLADEAQLADQDPGIESFLMQQGDLIQVKKCMDQLPEKQRLAVVLSLAEEISQAEISVELGMQVNAVKQLLFRARQGLAKCLEAAV
jgi:RNA polymerase sigma-70 factor (ECF subfamily)